MAVLPDILMSMQDSAGTVKARCAYTRKTFSTRSCRVSSRLVIRRICTEQSVVHGSDGLCVTVGVERSEIVNAIYRLLCIGGRLWDVHSNCFAHCIQLWYCTRPVVLELERTTNATCLWATQPPIEVVVRNRKLPNMSVSTLYIRVHGQKYQCVRTFFWTPVMASHAQIKVGKGQIPSNVTSTQRCPILN